MYGKQTTRLIVSNRLLVSLAAILVAFVIWRNDQSGGQNPLRQDPSLEPISDHSQQVCAADYAALRILSSLKLRDVHPPDATTDKQLNELAARVDNDTLLAPDRRDTFALSFTLFALVEGNQSGKYDRQIRQVANRIRNLQWLCDERDSDDNLWTGGVGSRCSVTPDLYHTVLAAEALRSAGESTESPFFRHAMLFISRCQMESKTIANGSIQSDEEGGFAISPNATASPTNLSAPQGNACGGLTCAGIKGLIHCGASQQDKRIQNAVSWLRRNYTLQKNPGMQNPDARLYDYYWSFATAMNLLDRETISDSQNVDHAWKQELVATLQAKQDSQGCWLNPNESIQTRESMPFYTTGLALLTIAETLPARKTSRPGI